MRVVHKGSLEVGRETEQKWPETPESISQKQFVQYESVTITPKNMFLATRARKRPSHSGLAKYGDYIGVCAPQHRTGRRRCWSALAI